MVKELILDKQFLRILININELRRYNKYILKTVHKLERSSLEEIQDYIQSEHIKGFTFYVNQEKTVVPRYTDGKYIFVFNPDKNIFESDNDAVGIVNMLKSVLLGLRKEVK